MSARIPAGTQPGQSQDRQPGLQYQMHPEPVTIRDNYRGSGKLAGKIALVTGGDSGIGRAVAVHFACEGADVAITYLDEDEDARKTHELVEGMGRKCISISGDLTTDGHCASVVKKVIDTLGGLDILVNNAAEQHAVQEPEALDKRQIERTFRTNVFTFFEMIGMALPHLSEGSCIINSGSVTGCRGHQTLLDYSATKGAIHALTATYAQVLAKRGIRVNSVAPGPIWTPLIPASFDEEHVAQFGANTLMQRPGQPAEVGPAYVFLASEDASFITGQIIHVNGGTHISV